jgi:hypothetical protein
MDKLEEISDGKKEEAPAAENDATSVGGREGRCYCRGQGCRHPGGSGGAAEETAAGIREDVAAAKINVDKPLWVSTETWDDVAVTEVLPPPTDSKIGTKQKEARKPGEQPAPA